MLIEGLVQVALRNSLNSFNSTFSNYIKNYISVVVFLKEGLVQNALRKTVVTGTFIERFKAVLYKRSWSFPLLKQSALKQLLFLILLLTSPRTNVKQYERCKKLSRTSAYHGLFSCKKMVSSLVTSFW